MRKSNLKIITAFILITLIFQKSAVGQRLVLNANAWAEKLSDPSDKENKEYYLLWNILSKEDSLTAFNFLDELKIDGEASSHYFLSRYYCLKASMLRNFNPPEPVFSPFIRDSIKPQVTRLFEQAMQHAFIVDDDFLAAFVSSQYGDAMAAFQNTEKAVMYMMYSAELYEKVGLVGNYSNYIVLGEMLSHIREYRKSIRYSKMAISLLMASNNPDATRLVMMCYNTIAIGYHRMKNYDSALLYYNKALDLTSKLKEKEAGKVWYGIVSGNIAQIDYARGQFATALPKFIMDYQMAKEHGVYDDAGNSAQWAAKTNLALGNKTEALRQIRASFALLKKWPQADNYRENGYQTAAEIFKSLGNNDSAYYYSDKYNALHDSLEKQIFQSGVSISQLRLNNEKNRYSIQKLMQEKKDQLQKRNYMIAAILLVFVIALLLINRQRQKLKFKSKMDDAEKARIRREMESARMQLKLFTQNIVEKSNLIEKLQAQLQNRMATAEEMEIIHDLTHQTILTEEDWVNFKSLFETLHPHFFEKITKQVDGITNAELRMAAFTVLRLTTRQMSAVLGISPNSVMKAKQRLRQRLEVRSDKEAEEFIAKI
jgi:tetratricopeptide (TPR) repeat protein/DNA-binding CsgD family transcriptional regulator